MVLIVLAQSTVINKLLSIKSIHLSIWQIILLGCVIVTILDKRLV
jgi:hypothetical protein